MAKHCPLKQGPALYTECMECDEKTCMQDDNEFLCLVVGSRTFTDYTLLKQKLDAILKNHQNITIVSGAARGADTLARKYASEKGYQMVEFPAEWDKYGKSAGYIRNEQMHQFISKAKHRGVVAFWQNNSKGTEHNFELAKKYNNPLRIINC